MAKPSDVIRALDALHSETAKRIARAPSRVVPGYNAGHGFAVTEDGRISYLGPASGPVLAIYELSADTNRTSGSYLRVNFNTQIYDPQSVVTTGASWRFTPPADGPYVFSVSSILVPGAALAAGEKVYFDLWPDGTGTGIVALAYQEIGVTETGARTQLLLEGTKGVYCYTTNTVNFRFGNGTGATLVQQGSGSQVYSTVITITKG